MALSAHFPGVIENGIASIGAQPVFYASMEGHHSLDKSAGLLGLGRRPSSNPGKRTLAARCATTGGRNQRGSGIRQETILHCGYRRNHQLRRDRRHTAVHEICRRYNIWLHVDGAYGAAVLFSNRHRSLVRGIEQADSVTFDPHKWLAMPFSAGLLLTRHSEVLERTFSVACPYLQKAPAGTLPDNRNISAQWSRRMNSLKLWLTLRVHGRQGYERLIDRQMRLAQSFARWVANSEYFELAAPQVLPILNLRVRAAGITSQKVDALHASIIEEVNRDGQRWISAATVNGQSVIRTMVISYLTEERHLKDLQASLLAACCSLGLESKSDTVPAVQTTMPSPIPLAPAPVQNMPPA